MCQYCLIVPKDVIARFARDKSLPPATRKAFSASKRLDAALRGMRRNLVTISRETIAPVTLAAAKKSLPGNRIYDCGHAQVLPGKLVARPQSSADVTARKAYTTTEQVARFYRDVFGRDSLDGAGMDLISSVHYGTNYNNAFWNGMQMTYGDGDGQIFVDFTQGNDVICHELAHGMTQYTLGLTYANEPGGLNESMSDVFGTMFRQWVAEQDVTKADWLIGKEIMGPAAHARGYTCLRSLSQPDAKHVLAPQPYHYSKYKPGMNPHEASGIPNFAFYRAATAIGGKSWEKAGQIWYRVLSGSGSQPNMKMKTFADRTRAEAAVLFPGSPAAASAVDAAWKLVGL